MRSGKVSSKPISTVHNRKVKKRFAVTSAVFLIIVTALWLTYQKTIFEYISRITNASIAMTENHLLTALDDEFSGMSQTTALIAGDSGVQAFLSEPDILKRYEQSRNVADIIRKAAYSHLSEYSVLTVTNDGSFFQFMGSFSGNAIEILEQKIIHGGVMTFTVLELDGNEYFCLVSPIYRRVSGGSQSVGYVAALSDMTKVRRVLTRLDRPTGIDTAVILNGSILISSNAELDGRSAEELERLYGSVTIKPVTGNGLYAVTAITNDTLYYGRRIFIRASIIALSSMLVILVVLYRFLSSRMVNPMLQNADDMQMGLLKTQIDAHFVMNTISAMKGLSEKGENEKAAIVAEHLAGMLKSIKASDEEINIYIQLKNLDRYIGIMNIRHDDKFTADINIDDRLSDYKMLGLILQPLAENALTHGLSNKTEDCRLNVDGRMEGEYLIFEVSDNGIGMEQAQVKALQDMLDTASDWDYEDYPLKGVALINIQKRILARYGKGYGLTFTGSPRMGCHVTVRLPLIREN